MRIVLASVLAATLAVSSAMAADNAPLAAGKPAGVHNADLGTIPLLGLVGVTALVAVLVGVTSNSGGYKSTFASSTTATTTTG